jgi:ferric-dicitrate binding protein FerR (iron transport regulator)
LAVLGWLLAFEALAAECEPVRARLVSLQGTIELRRTESAQWSPAAPDAVLCPGDAVRVGERSRAALRLANESTLRLDENTTLTLAPSEEGSALMELLRGAINVMTRTPKPFKVRTPFLNAGVEGTEFLVRVDADATRVVVFEGKVSAANDQGAVELANGDTAVARRDLAPRRERIVRPADAVQWALYYPSIIVRTAAQDAALREADALARRGRMADAFARLDAVPAEARNARHHAYRAELLLLVGRVEEARAQIARALEIDANSSDARALQALIAVVQNDAAEGASLAREAVRLDRRSAAAQLALSYAEQARFDIPAALAAAERATESSPDNAIAWARVAELRMASAELDAALAAAQRASVLDPQVARTQTVLGFAHLTRIETAAAREAFARAIELDQADYLPRLGLGLALIREGGLAAGREAIEIAASLDPLNSLVRSYLGKAYYEEKRGALAGEQFDIAKGLDPLDPTPRFYDAVRKQSENRPVEALDDFQRSIELNGNRIVSRSRLLVDQDLAARQVSQARTYQELGFGQLSLANAYKSLAIDFSDPAAHQFLSEAYDKLPRHDISRQSESLQAELRRPVSVPQPGTRLIGDTSFLFRDLSFLQTGGGEYGSLLESNGLRFYIDGLAGNRGTRGDRLLLGGLSGPLDYSIGHTHYATDGFESNNAVDRTIDELLVKGQVSAQSVLTFGLKRSELRLDETVSRFDPMFTFSTRIENKEDSASVGGFHAIDATMNFVWYASYAEEDQSSRDLPDLVLAFQERVRTHAVEGQLVKTAGPVQAVFGLGSTTSKERFEGVGDVDTRARTVYAYLRWIPTQSLYLHAGLSDESFDTTNSFLQSSIERHRSSPKLGVAWLPSRNLTIRAATYSNVRRPFIGSKTLEPTQVAGFNQFFSGLKEFFGDQNGTIARATSIAFDGRFESRTFVGGSVTRRDLSVPTILLQKDFDWKERFGRMYLYRALNPSAASTWQIGLSAEYERENLRRPNELTGPEGIVNVRTERLPLRAKLFYGNRFSFGVGATYVRQLGDFSVDAGLPVINKRSSAWITDVESQYRLPERLGALHFGVRNLFDRPLDVFDTDPIRPRFATRRLVFVGASVAF